MEIAPAIVKRVAVLVVHVFAVSFANEAILLQTAAGFVARRTLAELLPCSLVSPILFLVITGFHFL